MPTHSFLELAISLLVISWKVKQHAYLTKKTAQAVLFISTIILTIIMEVSTFV